MITKFPDSNIVDNAENIIVDTDEKGGTIIRYFFPEMKNEYRVVLGVKASELLKKIIIEEYIHECTRKP